MPFIHTIQNHRKEQDKNETPSLCPEPARPTPSPSPHGPPAAETAYQQQLHSLLSLCPTCARHSTRTSHPLTALETGAISAHVSPTGKQRLRQKCSCTHICSQHSTVCTTTVFGNVSLPAAPLPRSGPSTVYVRNGPARPPALPAETTADGHLPAPDISLHRLLCGAGRVRGHTAGGGHSPLMTSCRFTWPLGRLCRVPGGTSSRQPGGSSGSSSSPDRPGSPSSPGSGLWDRGLVKARLRAAQGGDVTTSVHPPHLSSAPVPPGGPCCRAAQILERTVLPSPGTTAGLQ